MPGVIPSEEGGRAVRTLAPRWLARAGDYVVAAAASADGERCIVGTGAGDLVAFDAASGAELSRVRAHEGGVLALAASPASDLIVTGGTDGMAPLWRLSAEGVRAVAELPPSARGAWVEHVAWAPDGSRVATAAGRVVRLWTSAGEPYLETEPHDSTVSGLQFGRRGDRLATIAYGGAHLWPLEPKAVAKHFAWKGSLIALAWSPDEKVLACGSQDASVHFWRVATGRDSEMTGYPFKPKTLAWAADSTLLATGGDKNITVWDFGGRGPEGRKPLELQGHQALCTKLAWSPRKGVLVSGAQDTGVIVWEPRRSKGPVAFSFLDDFVTDVVFHPREHLVFAADASGTVAAIPLG